MRLISSRRLIAALIFTQLVALLAFGQGADRKALVTLLSRQGFTGELKGKVEFTSLGTLGCNATKYRVFYYEWEESNPAGAAIHATQRVIFIRNGGEYVGSYVVEDRPIRLKPTLLVFHYPEKLGNLISCDQNGLPKSVLLNGEPHILSK